MNAVLLVLKDVNAYLIRPRHGKARRLRLQMLQKLLEVLVVVAGPILRILCIVVALLKFPPGGKTLQERADAHLKDILAVKLLGIDVEEVPTSIQILSQLLWNLHDRELIDLLPIFSIVERPARSSVHHQSHVNKEVKAHLRSQGMLC